MSEGQTETGGVWSPPAPAGAGRSWPFLAVTGLLGVAAVVGTLAWCGSMAGGMGMPGGWSMSMAWMRMPGQTWPGAAAAFVAMWSLMMVAMMLPSVAPLLWRVHLAARDGGGPGGGWPVARLAAGYFGVWAAAGLAIYPVGVAAAVAEMRWPAVARAVPAATGLVLLAAGLLQLTRWKARELARCRPGTGCVLRPGPGERGGFRAGARVGVHCLLCCGSLVAVQLALGVMNPGAMGAVALAIGAERLSARPGPVARATGAALVAAGTLLFARAVAAA
jgi:predicted metal-binding membrane protein